FTCQQISPPYTGYWDTNGNGTFEIHAYGTGKNRKIFMIKPENPLLDVLDEAVLLVWAHTTARLTYDYPELGGPVKYKLIKRDSRKAGKIQRTFDAIKTGMTEIER
ncbi:MAG: hypothetical protein HY514_04365, partial [Candidatus Aenigmarchaeota archaeon]|nr:hypothetical protein [Candidatus Aenigmarchaeota archaeon]